MTTMKFRLQHLMSFCWEKDTLTYVPYVGVKCKENLIQTTIFSSNRASTKSHMEFSNNPKSGYDI